jgi:AraC-like DNA-binding protein
MKVRQVGPFLVHHFKGPLIDRSHRVAARDAAARMVERLRESFDLPPQLETAIASELEDAYVWGLLGGIAAPDPKKAQQARDAIALLEKQRQNSAKGAAARRDRGAKTRERIRLLDQKLRATIPKKGVRVQKIAAELGMSTRTVERHLIAGR